jgi:hypothetical protein
MAARPCLRPWRDRHNGIVDVTSALGVGGFGLSVISIGLQAYTWRGSGSRVDVTARYAIFPAPIVPGGGLPDDFAYYPPPDMIESLASSVGLPLPGPWASALPKLVADIQNHGRLPVTVLTCMWQIGDSLMGSPNQPPGVTLPHRLAEHDQCISVIDLASVMSLVDAPNQDPAIKRIRQVRPVVELGNGRRIVGKPVQVPKAEPTKPDSQTSSGTPTA